MEIRLECKFKIGIPTSQKFHQQSDLDRLPGIFNFKFNVKFHLQFKYCRRGAKWQKKS